MAFDPNALIVFAYTPAAKQGFSGGFTLWTYKTADVDKVHEPGYFNAAKDCFRHGDMIVVSDPNDVQRDVLKVIIDLLDGAPTGLDGHVFVQTKTSFN